MLGAALVDVAIVIGHEFINQGEVTLGEQSGSGRLASWLLRIEILLERPLDDLLLGTGAATDRFYTSVWWWAAKDAHSDLLTLVIEYGLLGLLIAASIYATVWKFTSMHGRAVLLATLTASIVSNALFSRPVHAMLAWTLAIAAVQLQPGQPTRSSNDDPVKGA